MFRNCVKGSLLCLTSTSNVLVYPFRALLVCPIFVLGIRIAFIFRSAGTGFIFLSNGKGLRPSLNSIAGSIMLSWYSCTISLTLFRGFGIGLSVVENDLSSTDIMSLCFSICLMLGLGVDSAFCFNNNSLISFDLLSFLRSALLIYTSWSCLSFISIILYTHR